MKIEATVHKIGALKDRFFLVPDYQREYVWEARDQVERFLEDIDNEYDSNAKEQKSYFIGSIIIVKNAGNKYDVIDGQQRLTTIILTLCAFRDLLVDFELNPKQQEYFDAIKQWLSDFDFDTGETQMRLELQYEESKDFLKNLILNQDDTNEVTASIKKMQQAYQHIKDYLKGYLKSHETENEEDVQALQNFGTYFLTRIELVVIESENLSSALKIFETINQRGVSLNSMDLVKNLLFSQVKESGFQQIKGYWKEINNHLESCGEEQSSLRFLRYFLMARYHNGVLHEDEIYNWITSDKGKKATNYETNPSKLAKELVSLSKRYAELVNATKHKREEGIYHPTVKRIGLINGRASRQHLVLLLALKESANTALVEALANELESFFFFSNTMGIRANYNERKFAQWAKEFRNVASTRDLVAVLNKTLVPYIKEQLSRFEKDFLRLDRYSYSSDYSRRYVLGCIESTLCKQAGMPEPELESIDKMQIEHILPQKPKDDVLTNEFIDKDDYDDNVNLFGNLTLLEGTINQAINRCNDLNSNWFVAKQKEYARSDVRITNLLDHNFCIGKNTKLNKTRKEYDYVFESWDKSAIEKRQTVLLQLALDTWLLNGKRADS